MFMTEEGKSWKNESAWLIKQQLKKKFEKCSVTMRVYFPDLKRRDLDNLCKLIADCIMMSGVIQDDNWVILNEWHIKGLLDRDNPRVELEIEGL